jgi:low affinity Fe/Cu permease
MSNRLLQAVASAASEQPDSHSPLNPYAEFLFRVAEKFGVPTVLLLIVLWWMKTGIVQPLLDAHFEVVGKIVRGQEEHTESIAALGDKLDELIRVSRDAAEKAPTK